MSNVVTFPRRPNPIEAQAEYAQMEADFAHDQELLAEALIRDQLSHYRFTIGDILHPSIETPCAMCGGRMPKRGEAEAVRMPASLGGNWKAMHQMCFLGPTQWK